MKKVAAILLLLVLSAFGVTACGEESNSPERDQAVKAIEKNRENFVPYTPKNHVEGDNYNHAQELYDNPTTIIWCTAFPQSTSDPIVTIPIAGKLTSSSVSALPSNHTVTEHDSVVENASVDGLFHGSPPPYRYGFTPGGQYVDFFNMPTICTTQPLEFQRQSVSVKVDAGLSNATQQAEKALKQGDKKKAQEILQAAAGQ
jgi:hypothetical protein